MTIVKPYGIRLPEETIIWRYLDVSKFLNLILNSTLFFTRIDLLPDNYEGRIPAKQLAFEKSLLGVPVEHRVFYDNARVEGSKEFNKHIAANCWHINMFESLAMWKIYLKSGEGIAIKSNYNRLLTSFTNNNNRQVFIRPIVYENYDNLEIGNVLYGEYFHKRPYFSYENELRALVIGNTLEEQNVIESGGVNLNVKLNILIEEIRLAPGTPNYIFSTLTDLMKKFDYEFPILYSEMDK